MGPHCSHKSLIDNGVHQEVRKLHQWNLLKKRAALDIVSALFVLLSRGPIQIPELKPHGLPFGQVGEGANTEKDVLDQTKVGP